MLGGTHFRTLLGKSMSKFFSQIATVGITQHIVDEHHAAHARQLDTARLQWMVAADFRYFAAAFKLAFQFIRAVIMKATIGPVAMRAKHGW